MKTKILFIWLLIIPFMSFPQKKVNNKPMIKNEHKTWIIFRDNDFYQVQEEHSMRDLNYQLVSTYVDSAKIFPMIRKTISPKFLEKINKQDWFIDCNVSSYGDIVGCIFYFHESGANPDELAILSERIRNEIKVTLRFDREVQDLFYVRVNINPSPYVPKYKGKQVTR